MPSCHRVPVCPMTGESTNSQKMLLAAAIAEGTAVEQKTEIGHQGTSVSPDIGGLP